MLRVTLSRRCAAKRKFQVAIVGSGPGGFYVAHHLLKARTDTHIDIYERLPVPFGLSRYGVAPDHPEVKNVEKTFKDLLETRKGDVTLLTNVEIGKRGLPLKVLLDHYHAVVLAHGAPAEKRLGIPGERVTNVLSAKRFVEYYNTLPTPHGSPLTTPLELHRARRVVIIGNGNVALDCARVLAAPYKHFCKTDMNCFAVRSLMNSGVTEVIVVGRRDVEHSAFTTKEFRELTTLSKTTRVEVEPFDLAAAIERSKNQRGKQRQLELLHKFVPGNEGAPAPQPDIDPSLIPAKPLNPGDVTPEDVPGSSFNVLARGDHAAAEEPLKVGDVRKTIRFAYNLTPVAFHPQPDNKYRAAAIEFRRANGVKVIIECDAVLTSVGYTSVPMIGAPFDEQQGIIPNTKGRVTGTPRLYCSGWAKTGAKGVIASTLMSAADTAASIGEDFDAMLAQDKREAAAGEGSMHVVSPDAEPSPNSEGDANDAAGVGGAATSKPQPETKLGEGKYGVIDAMINLKLMPLMYPQVKKIWHVENLKGVDLGKASEKLQNVQDMIDIAGEGVMARRATHRVTGRAPARPRGLELLEDWLDPDIEIADLSDPKRVNPEMNVRL